MENILIDTTQSFGKKKSIELDVTKLSALKWKYKKGEKTKAYFDGKFCEAF